MSTLTRVLIAPASNMKVALPLYATIAIFLLLILVIGLMFVMATPEDEETDTVSQREAQGCSESNRERQDP